MGTPGVHAPAHLGRYELLVRLATGGMGEIFLARLEGAAGFEKLFVVKRILPHLADDTRFRAMLIAEARIASKMAHSNICQVYELGETDGQLYIVMEHLEGIALLPLLRRTFKQGMFLDLGLIGGVVQQCTDALHYAHELRDRDNELLGIVHRDVTPGNIFLTEAGMAKLLDFGIAKVKNAGVTTQTGTVKGKHAYMAPEQLRGATVDRRADVFALGVVIFEMLALRRLFQRSTDYLTFRAVIEQPIPDVRRFRPDVPDGLAEALARALDRDPDQRTATARQLGASILDAIAARGRPWTQGEIGDHVRTHFADALEKRRAVTESAIGRTGGAGARAGLQPIGPSPSPELPDDEGEDDDDDLPSVESSVEDDDSQERTPVTVVEPPLTAAPPPAVAPVPPLVAAATAAPPMVVHKRGLVWPLLALVMVGITALALFLVWKQTQQPKVIISQEPARDPATDRTLDEDPVAVAAAGSGSAGAAGSGSAGSAGTAGAGAGAGSVSDAGRPTVRSTKAPPQNPYNAVIKSYRPQMSKCVQDNPLPPGNAKMVIVVATTGKPKMVSFEPASLDSTPAGACIRSALSTATFPAAKEERTVTVPLSVPVKPS